MNIYCSIKEVDMYKYLLTIGFILSSFQLFAQDFGGASACNLMSKDPSCWRESLFNRSWLHCASNGKVQYIVYHGIEDGCGEVSTVYIKNQTRDLSDRTVYIETAWRLSKLPGSSLGICSYRGPIYGGGNIDTYLGTWKVVIDGTDVGAYTYSIDTQQESGMESIYTQSCKLSLI
jgi:hypothetical protein